MSVNPPEETEILYARIKKSNKAFIEKQAKDFRSVAQYMDLLFDQMRAKKKARDKFIRKCRREIKC